jgi:hypothetical protein
MAMHLKFIPGKGLPPDTPLWRYMSLGGLFLLLKSNQVFVPTIRKLQEAEPKEMRVRQHSSVGMPDCLVGSEPFQNAREWLKDKHRSRKGFDLDHLCPDAGMQNPSLVEEWISQLAMRRCAWCWFSPSKPPPNWVESMAMWNLYARVGVAIKTTLGRIIEAIREPELGEVLVAEVKYSLHGAAHSAFGNLEYANRPFLFKSASYLYESEVRLVFRVRANAVGAGLKINVDARTLLDGGEVIMSPFIVPDEANALNQVAEGLLPEASVRFRASSERDPGPNDPTHGLGWKDSLQRSYHPFGEEPNLPALLREL